MRERVNFTLLSRCKTSKPKVTTTKPPDRSREEFDGQINLLLYVQVMIKESGFDAICLVSSQN